MLINSLKINKQSFFLHTLILLSVVFFWFLFNISERIHIGFDDRITNLSRYNFSFNNYNLYFLLDEKLRSDPGYYFLTFFLNKIGIKFETFLFFLFYIYLFLNIKIYYKITNTKNIFFMNVVLILISIFWMNSILGVVLRQGCAFILICYCFFLNDHKYKKTNFMIFMIAISFHLSAIIFLPILFLNKYSKKKIILIDTVLIILIMAYVSGVIKILSFVIFDVFVYLELDVRSLSTLNHSTSGFSIYKLIAVTVPILAFRIFSHQNIVSKVLILKIYLFYSMSVILGFLLSELSYHDRILLYAWSISPVLLGFGFYNLMIKLSHKSISSF